MSIRIFVQSFEYLIQYWRIKFVVTFLSRFLDSRVGPINFRYSLSCGPGSQDSKLVLNFSVALFLLISWPFQWSWLTNGNIPKSSENHILINDTFTLYFTCFYFQNLNEQKYLFTFIVLRSSSYSTKIALKLTKIMLQSSVIPIWNPLNQGYKIGNI